MKKQKISIGSTEYDLLAIPQSEVDASLSGDGEDAGGAFACIDTGLCEIRIANDVPLQVMIQSFFHEATHGMLYEIGQGALSDDEGFVDAFSKQIYSLFMRNEVSKILSYLTANQAFAEV